MIERLKRVSSIQLENSQRKNSCAAAREREPSQYLQLQWLVKAEEPRDAAVDVTLYTVGP